jgi:predicted ABC-type ATPase
MDLHIVAGPNGAGKTTFAQEFLPNYADCRNFVNADLIAQGIAPFSPETAAIRAGRMMLTEMQSFAQKRVSFAFETTLSGAQLPRTAQTVEVPGVQDSFLLFMG